MEQVIALQSAVTCATTIALVHATFFPLVLRLPGMQAIRYD